MDDPGLPAMRPRWAAFLRQAWGRAELAASRYHDRQRYTGVTAVFRGGGNYLLSSVLQECSLEEYPQMHRASV